MTFLSVKEYYLSTVYFSCITVQQQISANFDSQMCPEPETSSLSELVSAGLMQFIAHIEEVSATATKEFALEETLKRMQAEWNDVRFEFLPYRFC